MRSALAAAIDTTDLLLMNAGRTTHFGRKGASGMLDFAFATPDVKSYWSLGAHTRGSNFSSSSSTASGIAKSS